MSHYLPDQQEIEYLHTALLEARKEEADLRAQLAAVQAEARAELAKKTSDLQECVDIAWGVIANAGGGDWNTQSFEWVDAASRWRDKWVAGLDKSKLPTPPTEGSAVEADRLAREAYDEWLHNPSGNSATANLRNKLCAVIGERENLRAQLSAAQEELGYWKAVDKQDRIEMQEVRDELAAAQAKAQGFRDAFEINEAQLTNLRQEAVALRSALENAKAEAMGLRSELENFIKAKPREWGDQSDQFEQWVKSRARAALAQKEGER